MYWIEMEQMFVAILNRCSLDHVISFRMGHLYHISILKVKISMRILKSSIRRRIAFTFKIKLKKKKPGYKNLKKRMKMHSHHLILFYFRKDKNKEQNHICAIYWDGAVVERTACKCFPTFQKWTFWSERTRMFRQASSR